MRVQTQIIQLGIVGVLLSATVTGLNAQSLVRKGSFEVGPFVGASYGIDDVRVIGGGNVTFALTKRILPYFEYSYFPGIGRTENGTFTGSNAPFKLNYSIPLSDFHGGFHIRFPIREKPIVPYLVIAFGGLRHSERTVTATYADASGNPTQTPLKILAGTDFAVNFGGGLRYYMSQSFGVRVEAKGYQPSSDSFPNAFGKVEVGFFFQLR